MDELERLIADYQPAEPTVELIKKAKIALLSGISGAGKDTIKKRLLQLPDFSSIVSHTTRAPRINNNRPEVDGVDYHFIDSTMAAQMLRNQEFIEAKFVHGTVYGTSAAEIRAAYEQNKTVIADIDVQGAAEYEILAPQSISIFIIPPDYETWLTRLKSRYTTEEAFHAEWPKRLASSVKEMTQALSVPYYHVIINDDLDRAVRVCHDIIERGDLFNQQDDEARLAARRLLENIRQYNNIV